MLPKANMFKLSSLPSFFKQAPLSAFSLLAMAPFQPPNQSAIKSTNFTFHLNRYVFYNAAMEPQSLNAAMESPSPLLLQQCESWFLTSSLVPTLQPPFFLYIYVNKMQLLPSDSLAHPLWISISYRMGSGPITWFIGDPSKLDS